MLLPVAAALLFLPEAGLPLRLMAVYFLAVAAAPLYWSLSRSAWLGTLAGLGLAALLLALRRSRAWFLAALVGLPLLAALAGWFAWETLPGVRTRVGEVLESKAESGGIRVPMLLGGAVILLGICATNPLHRAGHWGFDKSTDKPGYAV